MKEGVKLSPAAQSSDPSPLFLGTLNFSCYIDSAPASTVEISLQLISLQSMTLETITTLNIIYACLLITDFSGHSVLSL